MQVNLLKEHVEHFDAAIRSCSSRLGIQYSRYPSGSCGAASEALAEYLKDRGFGLFSYVLGYHDDQSHAWLEEDALIVDITAGQFKDAPEPIIVSADRSWHSKFEVLSVRENGSFTHWGDQDPEARVAYEIICQELSS